MSFLRSKQPNSTSPVQLNSINITKSRYGDPVPLVYGLQRIPVTLLWYGAFTATATTQSSGGKGGGNNAITGYNYTASCVLGLCEGPIGSVRTVWKDKALTTLIVEGLTLFTGAGGQAAWSYLTSNFSGQAVPYDHTAYLGAANLNLGSSAAIPNYTYEVQGFLSSPGTTINFTSGLAANATSGTLTSAQTNGVYDITFSDYETRSCTISGGTAVSWDPTMGLINAVLAGAFIGGWDADPSAIILDYCTDVNHGCNFQNVNSAIQGIGNTYQTYCLANSLRISPWEDTQRAASAFLADILEITNSNCVMSAGVLNIYPYADYPVTGNGLTYTPNLTPLFAFTDDDYMMPSSGGSSTINDPVQMTRKPLTDTYNVVHVEYFDRANNYNADLAEWKDPQDIAVNGIRVMPVKTFHQITVNTVALKVAQLIGQRQLYIRNTYTFSVRADLYSLLEPMDLVSITDSNLGIINKLCRVIETIDDANDLFTLTVEEMFVGTASAPLYNIQAKQGYFANYLAVPPSVATPYIFMMPAALLGTTGGSTLCLAVGPTSGGNYGGCAVYGSFDSVTYAFLGNLYGASRYGTIPANITSSATSFDVTVNNPNGDPTLQLNSASASDYAGNRSLIMLDGEVICFETATLVSGTRYTLSGPVIRGLFGTTAVAHSLGAQWARIDQSLFSFPVDPGMLGNTIYIKLPTFNNISHAPQTLTSATAYTHLLEASNSGQLMGGPLTLIGRGVAVVGHNVYKSATTTAWDSDVYSVQGYTNGAFVSFRPAQINPATGFMIALNTDPTTDSSYTSLDYAIECAASAAINIYESGAFVSTVGTYAIGDIFSITYDGAFVRYLQNGTLLHQTPAVARLTLYLDSSFCDPQLAAMNLQFGPYGSATPVLWIARGLGAAADTNYIKVGGTSSWTEGDCYSINGYPTAHIVCKIDGAQDGMIALVSGAPTSSINYTGLSYALDFAAGGGITVFESGTSHSVGTTYDTTTYLAITYDGSTITYWNNGVSLRTVAVSGLTVYGQVNLYTPNSGINSLEFGPTATIPLADTAQLGTNAAGVIASNFTATTVGVDTSSASPSTATVLSLTVTATGSPVSLDVSGTMAYTIGSSGVVTLQILRDGSALPSGGIYTNSGTASGTIVPNVQYALIATDSPAAGSHTYSVKITASGTVSKVLPTGLTVFNSYLKYREIKR